MGGYLPRAMFKERMPLQGYQHFPTIESWTEEAVSASGYTMKRVSIFDHTLSEEECSSCDSLNFEDALDSGLEGEYQVQEDRFLSFYRELFKDGVFRRTGVGKYHTRIVRHERWDRRLKKDVLHSLREQRLFDIYVPRLALRTVGGWDRTDTLLFENAADLLSVSTLASRCGLFLL